MAPYKSTSTKKKESSGKRRTITKKKESSGNRKFFKYTEEALHKAIEAVKNCQYGIREASRIYGVPKSTMQDQLYGRAASNKGQKVGPDPVLGLDGEIRVRDWIIGMAKCGFPIKKQDLLDSVAKIVNETGQKNPFKDGKPGETWYQGFRRRHPEISVREAEGINKARAAVTEEKIRAWFKTFVEYLTTNNTLHVLDDPRRIFNGDEAGFSLCPKTGKVLAPKGYKNVYKINQGNEKENLTVLAVFNANGEICPPMVVFPYVRPPKSVVDSMPKSWVLGKSNSGWMKGDVFYEYIANAFNTWLIDQNIPKPIILLLDGHKSHMTMPLSEFCESNGIILYTLPPNSTHIMQPADVSLFKPLKQEWKKTLSKWQSKPENANQIITKTNFCKVFKDTMSLDMSNAIKNGFRKCGLYPLDPNEVDYTKCVRNAQRNIRRSNEQERLTAKDFDRASKVISFLRPAFAKRGIDADIILKDVEEAKKLIPRRSSATPRTSAVLHANEDPSTVHIHPQQLTLSSTMNETLPFPEIGSLISLSDLTVLPLTEESVIMSIPEIEETIPAQTVSMVDQIAEERERENILMEEIFTMPLDHCESTENRNGNEKETGAVEVHTIMNIDEASENEPPRYDISNSRIDESTSLAAVEKTSAEIHVDKTVEMNLKRTPQTVISITPIEEDLDAIHSLEADNPDVQFTTNTKKLSLAVQKNQEKTVDEIFKKHLQFPDITEKKSLRKNVKLPSAISSEAWREIFSKKEQEKQNKIQDKENRRMMKQKVKTEKGIKKKGIIKKKFKNTNTNIQPKIKCNSCTEPLISDTEEDLEKNIGCDRCIRWYHLKCTSLCEHKYVEAAKMDYVCEFCTMVDQVRDAVLQEKFG